MSALLNWFHNKQLNQVATLRLSDPDHPARRELDEASQIVDRIVKVNWSGDRTMVSSETGGELLQAVALMDEAIAHCPDDLDLLVAKAGILHAAGQFKSAEDLLDEVLQEDTAHFEARTWKNHWFKWTNALQQPGWDEARATLQPVMVGHVRLGHVVQVVRDGLQKTLAIVKGVQGPPFDSRTKFSLAWVLSQTPMGPLVAYYLKITEPSGEPSTMEAFLPGFKPDLHHPMEGYYLVQQLAFTPYCFVVLHNDGRVMTNRRVVLGEKTTRTVKDIANRLASASAYLPQDQFQAAMQWHMNSFDMKSVMFDD